MMDRNDKYGIEKHGVEKWHSICDYMDAIEKRAEKLRLETHGDIVEMYRYIRRLIVRPGLSFQSTIQTKRNGDKYIYFESSPIKSDDPVLNLMVKEIRVSNFGGGVSYERQSPYDVNFDLNKEVEMMYWFSIHFDYEHHSGGGNGTELATAYRKESGEWIFKAVNE